MRYVALLLAVAYAYLASLIAAWIAWDNVQGFLDDGSPTFGDVFGIAVAVVWACFGGVFMFRILTEDR